jgi:hypothetical protein
MTPKEEPKQELEKEMFELEQQLDIPSNLRWHNSKPKQETLEEVAENYSKGWGEYDDKKAFIAGAKWQQERSYSEEEVIILLQKYRYDLSSGKTANIGDTTKFWFEQFKNK